MNDHKKLLLAAATVGLMGAAPMAMAAEKGAEKVMCYGVNGCKGQGVCHGKVDACSGKEGCQASVSCKGSNSCKGKGFVKLSKKECTDKGGKVGM